MARINGAEIFEAGRHRGKLYTPADLDRMVENFNRGRGRLDVPMVVGHEEDQEFAGGTGAPAFGWVTRLYRKGLKLFADIAHIPQRLAGLIESRAYRKFSSEVYDDPPEGLEDCDGRMLRRLALLGGELPQIKTLADVPEPEPDDRPIRPWAIKKAVAATYGEAGSYTVFYEVVTMAESGVEQVAVAAVTGKWPDLPPEFVESLTPDQMGMLAPALGGMPPEEELPPLEEPPPDLMDEPGMPGMDGGAAPVAWPEGMDRDAVIAELATMGEDPDALALMTDEELLDLWNALKGAPMSEIELGGDDMTTTPATTTPPTGARQPKKVTLNYSEARVRALETRTKAAIRNLETLERAQRNRLAQERKATVTSFCERMVKEGRLSPAQAEAGKGPVWCRLMRADAARRVAKFGEREGLTELEAQMAEIEQTEARRFNERVKSPADPAATGTWTPERRKELLSHTSLGRAVLRATPTQNKGA